MNLCVVFLVVMVVVVCSMSVTYGEVKKCCESNHSFEKVNGTFTCSDIPSNNSHILTSATNFLENNTDGQCVEFFENFYIFNISKSVISQFKIVDEKKVYSKCCPVNFLYNTFTHGCEEAENVDSLEIKKNFIKVGLKTCKVIVDEIVENSTEEFESDCVDRTTNGSFILRKCKDTEDICWKLRCVQKCCPDGQIFLNKQRNPTCIEGYRGINLTKLTNRKASEFPEDPFATVFTNKFSDRYFINESKSPSYLNRRGIFSFIATKARRNITSSNYCLEYVKILDEYFFMYTEYTDTKIRYYAYILPISVILEAITIITYFLLNEVNKIFGKILVNYCFALLIWDGQLAYNHLGSKYGCFPVAFIAIFSRIAIISWPNALCWNTWRTFGSMTRINDVVRKKKHHKTILLYCLYAWGIPMVVTLLIFLFHTYSGILPNVIQPLIGCYIKSVPGNHSKLLFLDMPDILLQVVNIVLFVKTTMYCLKVKKEIAKINDNTDKKEQFKRNKAKLYLVFKLIIIMGVTFIPQVVPDEIISGPVTAAVYQIFNVINSSQGIFVFIIFICNRQIYNKIKKKLGISNAANVLTK